MAGFPTWRGYPRLPYLPVQKIPVVLLYQRTGVCRPLHDHSTGNANTANMVVPKTSTVIFKHSLFYVIWLCEALNKVYAHTYKPDFPGKDRCPLGKSQSKTTKSQNVAERQQTVPERGQNESANVHREKLPPFCKRSANVLWNETKGESWAVFNFAAIFTVLCYHMRRFSLWLVDIDSKWLPPQLYQMRSYRNPTLLTFVPIQFGYVLLRSATLSFVILPVDIGLKWYWSDHSYVVSCTPKPVISLTVLKALLLNCVRCTIKNIAFSGSLGAVY